ncbi:MAG: phosphocholine cytidylyltransferase family protein [Desulfobacca sp.]|uniref:phosphocholine cytidylyltransferase family protein n=1 Tax=Desulfobacca sp. TaxID=2067990 RepID=UPI00404B1BD4
METKMLAVILTAGVGRRLAPLTTRLPKALIDVGGRPLLYHTLDALQAQGVREVVLVVGHLQDLIREALADNFSALTMHWVVNEDFSHTGSLYSLWLARDYLTGPFLFMDADLLFHPQILAGWLTDTAKSSLLVGPLHVDSGEEVKVTRRQGRATAVGKSLSTDDPVAGEAVGMVKIAGPDVELAKQLMADLIQTKPTAEHEELSQALCDQQRLWVHDIGHLSWLEIDFPEDVIRAREVVWPAIQRQLIQSEGK